MNWTTLLCDDRIRSYKKSSSTDLRTEFEKDYHRIIGLCQDQAYPFPGGILPGQVPGAEYIREHTGEC